MSDKRRALGRGLGALIPQSPAGGTRPVDVFFPGAGGTTSTTGTDVVDPTGPDGPGGVPVAREADPSGGDPADRLPPASEPGGVTAGEGSSEEAAWSAVAAHGAHESSERDDSRAPGEPSTVDSVPDDPQGLAPVPGATFAELPVGAIRPNPRQPRTVFDEDDMAELVHSVREIGVLQPVVVRRVAGAGEQPAYELVMGERRWRASEAAGLATVPAIVKDTHDDDLLRDALLENLHRAQLNPLEEAAAYQQLLDDFGCTQEELASRLGRSRPQVSNTLRLLRLPPLVARRVAAGVLSAGHARALLGLPDAAAMERLAQRIVAEGLSVRSVEEVVALGGEEEQPARRRPRAGTRHPQLDDLAAQLSDRLDTRVAIALGQRKGRLTVEFASVEDLHRILDTLDLGTPAPGALDPGPGDSESPGRAAGADLEERTDGEGPVSRPI